MKRTLILTSALCGLAFAAQAQNKEVNVVSWGGSYEKSQVEAYNKPFTAETGITVNMIAADNPATPLRAQVEAGNVTGDVFDVEVSDAIRLCDEGALVEIDPAAAGLTLGWYSTAMYVGIAVAPVIGGAALAGGAVELPLAGAAVTAIDLSAARLARVEENLSRTGLSATLVAGDALDWRPEAALDGVLLDAPCSATGTIRRHPELPLIRDGGGIADLTALQAALIDHALTLLRPGGRLVYAVCSLLPAEGEDQLAAALSRHPALRVERPDLPGIEPAWITEAGGLRLRPDYWPARGGMDGFFIARLVRDA